MKPGREKSRRGLSLGGGGCVGVCDHLKPSQEVAGSGRVGEKRGALGDGAGVGGVLTHSSFLYTVGPFSQNPQGSWQRDGGGRRWKGEGSRAWLKCQPTLQAKFLGRARAWLPPTEENLGLQDGCHLGCEYLTGWRQPSPMETGGLLSARGLSAWQMRSGAQAADRGAKAGGSSGPHLALGIGVPLSYL